MQLRPISLDGTAGIHTNGPDVPPNELVLTIHDEPYLVT